ncbi:MAG TPA: heme exporter protein CcmD [Acidimicrobiia bacterium]
MNYAGYVITGYVLTGAVLGGYWLRTIARTRRAERSLGVSSASPTSTGDVGERG